MIAAIIIIAYFLYHEHQRYNNRKDFTYSFWTTPRKLLLGLAIALAIALGFLYIGLPTNAPITQPFRDIEYYATIALGITVFLYAIYQASKDLGRALFGKSRKGRKSRRHRRRK